MCALNSTLSQPSRQDSAASAFKVMGCHVEVAVMEENVIAFSNRKYVFDVVPDALVGWQFTRLGGGLNSRLRLIANRDVTVYGATSLVRQRIDMTGWTRHPNWELRYTDGGHTRMPVFTREFKAGEELDVPEGSWTGLVILSPKLDVETFELHPEHTRVPGIVVDHVPAVTGTYVGSPSIAILPDGSYLASHDLFGGKSGANDRKTCTSRVFRSVNRGEAWSQVAEIKGAFWSTLFVHRGSAYLMGTTHRYGHVAIRRSDDGGKTWTEPHDESSGLLLADARYHCAPVPVLIHDGRIWRAMEDAMGEGGWGDHFRSFMMSAPVDADLLSARSWTCSNRLPRSKEWREGRFKGWLEGNAVATPDGEVVNILRAEDHKYCMLAASIRISADGKTATFDPEAGFSPMPGANHNKFTIRFDPETGLYWSLTNYRPTSRDVRNVLALICSKDLQTWNIRSIILYHPESGKHGFQYVDWQFDGPDMIVASRTAYDDGEGGAHNFHDANFLTFHRITDFRAKSMSDSHPLYLLYHGRASQTEEKQVTTAQQGHILTNANVWSADSGWLAYDVREVGHVFDGARIERVDVNTGDVQVLYESGNGATCGVVTTHPTEDRVVFIHGPENPTDAWSYAAAHRRGVVVSGAAPGAATNLDARDLVPPFTPGALRGGTHVHTFSGQDGWVSSTYEDDVLAALGNAGDHDLNQRNVAVSVPGIPVTVGAGHARNHDGTAFTVLVTRTVNAPRPGSDEISKAFSDAWVGTNGYVKADGTRQAKAIAFQGHVRTAAGTSIAEVFIVDLPTELTHAGDTPLAGTVSRRPAPPKGVVQRRLTYTADREHPGLQGPRHWLRSSPDGLQIAFLMKDDRGVVQFWTVSPNGGQPAQVTRNPWSVQSAFSWSPDGQRLAYVMDNSVFVTDVATGTSTRLTERRSSAAAPTDYCCCFSPDGTQIAYTCPVRGGDKAFDQVFVVSVPR